MTVALNSLLASVAFWQRFGLSSAEIGERVAAQYPSLGSSDIAAAISLQAQLVTAGQAIQQAAGGMPVYGINLPVVPGQSTPFSYGLSVPVYDPNSDASSSVFVRVQSAIPLSYTELESRALGAAGQTIELSPEKFITPSGLRFSIDLLTPQAVQVVSASTWSGPQTYAAFGS